MNVLIALRLLPSILRAWAIATRVARAAYDLGDDRQVTLIVELEQRYDRS